MREHEDALKQKKWSELKTAVGTMVMQGNVRQPKSLDDLLLNIKNVGFDTFVCQTEVKSARDKETLISQGYEINLTEGEFKEHFEVEPSCVWYTPSIGQNCLYFNPYTLAAAPFPIQFYETGIYKDKNMLYRTIREREAEAANSEFLGSVMTLPEAAGMEYFNLLVEEKGTSVPDLYDLFFSIYINNDYGFEKIAPETLQVILGSKTEEERKRTTEKLREYPDVLKIYRGGNSASTPYEKAYSWSLDPNVANFFACRRGFDEGYIVEAEVAKKDVIEAFLDDRGEQEIVVEPEHVKVLNRLQVKGVDFIKPILPEIAPMYQKYRDQMGNLEFAQESDVHGCEHQARVLLLSLIIAHHLDLPMRDRKVLATAAIYHDTQRSNDDVDPSHGKAAGKYYRMTNQAPDPLVEFLCEYHCLPDEVGHHEIRNNRKLSKDRGRSKLLIDIFKDADALDRVRFGLRGVDINQLRLPISKGLSLVARICLEQIKVERNRGQERAKRPIDRQILQAAARVSEGSISKAKEREQRGF